MPGANCAILNCSTSRNKKGIAIFRVPTGEDDFSKKWRENIINIVTKDRIIDGSLRKQIENKSLYTCELHYPEDKLIRNTTKTTRIPGALPTLNLPKKSFSRPDTVPRSTHSLLSLLY